jgi:AAA domain
VKRITLDDVPTIPSREGPSEPDANVAAHSWQPIDLVAAAADPPEPPMIGGLLYPAKRTLLSGETESLKTWLALILAKAEMDAGYAVGWADLDGMGRGEILARLRAIGVTDADIARLFLYYEPDDALMGSVLADVLAEISEHKVRLFVIDAFNAMLNVHGLNPMDGVDIETFWREIAQPICNSGATPGLIDHVPKNLDNRGKYAIGSERKASGAHIHIGFKPLVELKRGSIGKTLLKTRKDRAGFLPRPDIGILELISNTDGSVSYSLQADRSHQGDEFRPTFLMERVSEFLASKDKGLPRGEVEKGVQGKAEYVRTAMDVLVSEGYAKQEDGLRGAKLIEHIRLYREADDEPAEPEDPTSSRPRPDLVPKLVSTP